MAYLAQVYVLVVEYAIKKNHSLKVINFFWKKFHKFLVGKIKGKLHSFRTQRTTEYIDEEIKMIENRKTSEVFVAVSQSTHSGHIKWEPHRGLCLGDAFWRTGQYLIHVWVPGSCLGFDKLPLLRKHTLNTVCVSKGHRRQNLRHFKGQHLHEKWPNLDCVLNTDKFLWFRTAKYSTTILQLFPI